MANLSLELLTTGQGFSPIQVKGENMLLCAYTILAAQELSLTTLNYFGKNSGDQRVFSIRNHHECLS